MRGWFVLLLAACSPRHGVSSEQAPKAIGPYSQAVDCGDAIYLSGQIPIDPATNQMIEGDIKAQTERVILNLQAVLKSAGLTLDDVVKTTVYMTDLKEFPQMNEVYGRYFAKNAPARATVQVAALPKGARIEIEAIARR